MHQQRTNISSTYSLSERQKKHRNFNIKLPIRFTQTRHRATRLDDYSPRSRMINNLVKFDLHKIKDA